MDANRANDGGDTDPYGAADLDVDLLDDIVVKASYAPIPKPPPPKRTKGGLAKKQQKQKRTFQCVPLPDSKRRREDDGYASDMCDDGPDAAFWKAVREDIDATGRFAYYFPLGDLCVKIGEDRSLAPKTCNELHVLMTWRGREQTGVEKLLQLVGKGRIVHVLAVFKETAEAKGFNVTMGSPQAVWTTIRNGAFLDRPRDRPRPSLTPPERASFAAPVAPPSRATTGIAKSPRNYLPMPSKRERDNATHDDELEHCEQQERKRRMALWHRAAWAAVWCRRLRGPAKPVRWVDPAEREVPCPKCSGVAAAQAANPPGTRKASCCACGYKFKVVKAARYE